MKEAERNGLQGLKADFESIMNNIEWNMAGLVCAAVITRNPKLLELQSLPLRVTVDGLDMDGFQCLGVALLEKDRHPRADELIAAAKRSLICESLEITADFLARCARVVNGEHDPYLNEDYFSVDIRELWNTRPGRAGALITEADRAFVEKCAAPLRNFIRHNNGKIPPKRSVTYSATPRSKPIEVQIQWSASSSNQISMPLRFAHDIFITLRELGSFGIAEALRAQDARFRARQPRRLRGIRPGPWISEGLYRSGFWIKRFQSR